MTWLIVLEAALRFARTITLASVAVAGSAFVMTGGASAAQTDSVTGGGQILVGSDGGAGDTIAFTARGTADEGTGQVQYVNRTGGTGQGQTVLHGVVSCVDVDGNTAAIAGRWNDGTFFDLYVVDMGNGDGTDMIGLESDNDEVCDYTPDMANPQETALMRGNAQVRDNTP